MFGFIIIVLIGLGLFFFHLAALFLFMIAFLLSLMCTGDFITALAAGIVGAIAGVVIQFYVYKKCKF